jgi:hypothetical protein
VGLFLGLLTLPLAPARGVVWVAEKLRQEALRQLNDPMTIRQALQDTHDRWLAGEISDEERAAEEDAFLARLLASRDAGLR